MWKWQTTNMVRAPIEDRSVVSASERMDRLRLLRCENVGPITYQYLLSQYGDAGAALTELPNLAKRGGKRTPISIPTRKMAQDELDSADKAGAVLVFDDEPDYPPLLRHIPDRPPILFSSGHAVLGRSEQVIAIVGARNASAAGSAMARQLAAELSESGWRIVSGLARGVDAAAHEASLAYGTIAVMAGGINRPYPRETLDLFAEIGRNGLLLSEMPPNTEPIARMFPRRNRIIAGMAQAVVLVEAATRSGSLITARLARDYGREILVVPGSPLDPRSSGGNRLIQDGARLVTSSDDVIEILQSNPPALLGEREQFERNALAYSQQPIDETTVAAARQLVISCLSATSVTVDEIVRQCATSPGIVQVILLELEIAGRLARESGQRVAFRY